ncbi:hypothetical protein SY88_22490 [Clostridiales bacterium PH28_bin88]|nr:hypothetical protein SY88_22490 [Clostridiales bacterium PH28_bin88]
MHLDFNLIQGTLIVRVHGELDLSVAERFRAEIDTRLEQNQPKNLLLDMGGVSFIDSSGLGVILGRYKRLSQQGGRMAITRAQPQVRRILELSGIMRVMGIYHDEAGALGDL